MFPALLHFKQEDDLDNDLLIPIINAYRSLADDEPSSDIISFQNFLNTYPEIRNRTREILVKENSPTQIQVLLVKPEEFDLEARQRSFTVEERVAKNKGEDVPSIDIRYRVYYQPILILGKLKKDSYLASKAENVDRLRQGEPIEVFELIFTNLTIHKYQSLSGE